MMMYFMGQYYNDTKHKGNLPKTNIAQAQPQINQPSSQDIAQPLPIPGPDVGQEIKQLRAKSSQVQYVGTSNNDNSRWQSGDTAVNQ